MNTCRRICFSLCLGFSALMSAANVFADQLPPLPTSSDQWINAPVMTYEQLKGKAVFFWFYEETCPNCVSKWKEMNDLADVFEDKPIIFLGVNSGNSANEVQKYMNKVGVKWPVIVDVDRSLEAAAKIPTISLQNISQVCYVTHDSEFHIGQWNDIQATIENALRGASWKIEPDEIAEPLKTTWRSMEFGNYKGAGLVLKKSLNSGKKDVAPSARKLKAMLDEAVTAQIEQAKAHGEADNHWLAFEDCQKLTEQFQGAEMPSEFNEFKKSLLKQATVKAGMASRKTVDSARRNLDSGTPLTKKSKTQLSKIVSDFPDSMLARQAEQVMNQSSGISE